MKEISRRIKVGKREKKNEKSGCTYTARNVFYGVIREGILKN